MKTTMDNIAAGASPGFDALIEAFGEAAPMLRELKATPQDAEWHAEGDVEAHVRMVLDETWDLLDQRGVTGGERVLAALAALFHDVAKPLTTRERVIDGRTRIVAPRHADRGRSYLAYRTLEWGLSPEVRQSLLALVGHHHDPRRLVADDAPTGEWRRLAELASCRGLYQLEVADIRGRTCSDKAEQLETLEMFRLYAEEHGVWSRSVDPWADWREHVEHHWRNESPAFRRLAVGQTLRDARRGEIHTPEEGVARSWKYRDGFGQLVVLCGPSGCGKSSWIQDCAGDWEVISLDAIRRELTGDAADQSRNGEVRQLSQERLKRALSDHHKVVWDGTNLRRDFRRVPLGIGRDYGALTTLMVFEVGPTECARRNRERDRTVPPVVLQRQFETAEFPYLDEAHEVEMVAG